MVMAVDKTLGKATMKTGPAVAEEYFALSELLENNIRLARNLSDPARTAPDKQELAHTILGSKLSEPALAGVLELAAGRWSSELDLQEACRLLANHVLLKTAQDNGQLEDVERDIFAMSQVVSKNRDLRNFLTDNHRAPLDQRLETFNSLVGSGVKPLALRLVNAVIAKAAPGRLASDLRALLDSAARMRQRGMATVYTATPLSETQQSRLIQLLSARSGEQVEVNVVIDPNLVGGIKIVQGDTVMDGAVKSRAEQFRRKLAS